MWDWLESSRGEARVAGVEICGGAPSRDGFGPGLPARVAGRGPLAPPSSSEPDPLARGGPVRAYAGVTVTPPAGIANEESEALGAGWLSARVR